MNTFHKVLFALAIFIANCISADATDFVVDGLRYSVNSDNTTVTVARYSQSKPTGDLTIPPSVTYDDVTYSVTTIGDCAFWNCFELTSVTIPNSVTSIGDEAFTSCHGLTSVTIPNSVTSIGDEAFQYCHGLTSVTIPNSVTSIGNYALFCSLGLTSVTIGNSVTSIGEEAFSNCPSLASIKVDTGNKVYDSRENCNAIIKTATNTLISGCKNTIIPNSVTSIGDRAFNGSGLTSVTIPNSVTSIGDEAFQYCDGLTSVTIGNSVTRIGERAFSDCSGLTSVTIPNSVTSIGNYAFEYCSGLTRIDAYPNPAKVSMGSDVFYKVPKDGTLHVLPKYLSAYQTASQWKEFYNIKADLTETDGIEEVRIDELDGTLPMDVYNMNGVKVGDTLEGLPAGIYIVRQDGKSAKVMK